MFSAMPVVISLPNLREKGRIMDEKINRENQNEYRKPDFLFRAVMIFIVAALVIVNIVLTYSTNNLKKEVESLRKELDNERLKYESLEQRADNPLSTDEEIRKEAMAEGFQNKDSIVFEANLPNSN